MINNFIHDKQKKSFIIDNNNNYNISSSLLKHKLINQQKKSLSTQKKPSSIYKQFIRQQNNNKQNDNFSWLQIKTKYPMLQGKLKSKLIQTINQDKNQKRIRQLIEKKNNKRTGLSNTNAIGQKAKTIDLCGSKFNIKNSNHLSLYSNYNTLQKKTQHNQFVGTQDQKITLINESLVVQQYDKTNIQYTWTQQDQIMFNQNIKQLKIKCSQNIDLLKMSGRYKFIKQKQFETLACQEISRMLNKNNKIYLSREFLLDKYYSTTEVLTEQEIKFILKTSPMLSKCVDKTFIKNAIKNIKYQNISDLELKIAQDIIMKFQKLRNTVRASRKKYKQSMNKATKQRIVKFQKAKEIEIARQIAQQQLKKHQIYLTRSLNYQNKQLNISKFFSKIYQKTKQSISSQSVKKLNKKNIWNPLNRYHPPTGLFVKDCNQQCTDDLFNSYQIDYLKKINNNQSSKSHNQNKSILKKDNRTKIQMFKFYSGGPDQNINQTFYQNKSDIENICKVIKSFYFQKKIVSALQSIQLATTRRHINIMTSVNLGQAKNSKSQTKIKKTEGNAFQEDQYQAMAKQKIIESKDKNQKTVYVNKLLHLAAENSFQSLKALNPTFTVDQVNSKDKNGNTALYYTAKFGNQQFSDFLIKFGANPNIQCEKKNTPLHLAFKSNKISLILKFLTVNQPNLNALNVDFKTPLAFCSRQILKKLNLQNGIASLNPKNMHTPFDNNSLLEKSIDRIKQDCLQMESQLNRKMSIKSIKDKNNLLSNRIQSKFKKTITSIKQINRQ